MMMMMIIIYIVVIIAKHLIVVIINDICYHSKLGSAFTAKHSKINK